MSTTAEAPPDPHDRRPKEQAEEPQKEAHIDKVERLRNHLQRDWTTFNYVLDGDVSPVKTEKYARQARDRLANVLNETEDGQGQDDQRAQEVYHDDVHDLLEALGLGTHARPESPHEVVHSEILPEIERLQEALELNRDVYKTGNEGYIALKEKHDALKAEVDRLRVAVCDAHNRFAEIQHPEAFPNSVEDVKDIASKARDRMSDALDRAEDERLGYDDIAGFVGYADGEVHLTDGDGYAVCSSDKGPDTWRQATMFDPRKGSHDEALDHLTCDECQQILTNA